MPGTRFDFAVVQPDSRGMFEMRQLGTITAGQEGLDDRTTLRQLKFIIGDYVDVAVYMPDAASVRSRDDEQQLPRRRGRGFEHDNRW